MYPEIPTPVLDKYISHNISNVSTPGYLLISIAMDINLVLSIHTPNRNKSQIYLLLLLYASDTKYTQLWAKVRNTSAPNQYNSTSKGRLSSSMKYTLT